MGRLGGVSCHGAFGNREGTLTDEPRVSTGEKLEEEALLG